MNDKRKSGNPKKSSLVTGCEPKKIFLSIPSFLLVYWMGVGPRQQGRVTAGRPQGIYVAMGRAITRAPTTQTELTFRDTSGKKLFRSSRLSNSVIANAGFGSLGWGGNQGPGTWVKVVGSLVAHIESVTWTKSSESSGKDGPAGARRMTGDVLPRGISSWRLASQVGCPR
jgi:hypothetical protein